MAQITEQADIRPARGFGMWSEQIAFLALVSR